MTIRNGYATLAQYKAYGIANAAADTADDVVIEGIIESASRYIDAHTQRKFYPRVETRYYSVTSDPQLWLDDDLLAVTTLTNGNADVITSTDYNLLPRNAYPKYAVRIKSTSNVYWQVDSDASGEYVISLLGIWGCHIDYGNAWKLATTVSEGVPGLNATDLTFTLASGVLLDALGSQIIKIENELMITDSVATNDVTVQGRGGNGSTAAVHATGTAVYLWQFQKDIAECCLEIVNGVYKRRTGENMTSASVLTAGGVMITPRDIPELAASIIRNNARIV